jgi:small subunit ribosomal protein S6
MRIYEELFIVRPDTPEEEIDALNEQIQHVITSSGGTVNKTEKWGVRKLAYRVSKFNEGAYVLIEFQASPSSVKELERRLRVNDAIIKFITVRIDEKLKKIEKRKKAREKRAARRPAPAAMAPQAPMVPAEPAGPVPGAPAPGAPAPAPAEPVAE